VISQPNTEQVLRAIAQDLKQTVLPDVASESGKVMVGMMVQMLQSCAERAAHEIAWAHEEAHAIGALAGSDTGEPASLHLGDVLTWYGAVSRTLSEGVEQAYRDGDPAAIDAWRALIDQRRAHEAQVLGTLDLVGRG